jgi:hypothetical protein
MLNNFAEAVVKSTEQAFHFAIRLLWLSARLAWPRVRRVLCWLSAWAAVKLANAAERFNLGRRSTLLSSRLFVAAISAIVWAGTVATILSAGSVLFGAVLPAHLTVAIAGAFAALGVWMSPETWALVAFRFLTRP